MAVIAGFALVIGAVLLWHRAAPRAVIGLWLIAGVGIAGWIGGFLDRAGAALATWLNTLSAQLIGVSITGALVAGLGVWLWIGLRKQGPRPRAAGALPWVALGFASLLPLLGGQLGAIGNDAVNQIANSLSTFATELVVG